MGIVNNEIKRWEFVIIKKPFKRPIDEISFSIAYTGFDKHIEKVRYCQAVAEVRNLFPDFKYKEYTLELKYMSSQIFDDGDEY